MSIVYKNISEYMHQNKLPKKLEVDVDGYGLYNTSLRYGVLCMYNKMYINTYSKIEFRKLINNGGGVFDNVNKLISASVSEVKNRIPENKSLVGKHLAILMGMDGNDFEVCCLHKYKDEKTLRDEFEYLFKSIVKRYKDELCKKS